MASYVAVYKYGKLYSMQTLPDRSARELVDQSCKNITYHIIPDAVATSGWDNVERHIRENCIKRS